MIEPDDVNTLIAEDRKYNKWEREQKNRILNIHNPTRKQEEWKRLFGVRREQDDSYLLGGIY